MKSLLLLFLAVGAQAIDVGQPDRGARVIGQVLYTDVGVTTTTTAGTVVHFSTITIPANTLARNGDSVLISCDGTVLSAGGAQIRMMALELNGVVITTRSASNAAATVLPWAQAVTITRTGSSANITMCGPVNGPLINICTSPTTAYGPSAINESIAWVVACAGKSETQGATSFLRFAVTYIPAP